MMKGSFVTSLRNVERQLRVLIADAAVGANPQRLSQLVGWLADVERILAEASSVERGAASAAGPATNNQTSTHVASVRGLRRARSATQYPVFLREGENLVKVGWSKKAKEEYEHKAPKSVIHSLVTALSDAGRGGKRILMEKLLPVKDASSGSVIPDYQTYVALAWLRDLKLVTQHGRQGYTVKVDELRGRAQTSWESLTTR